MFLLDRVWRHTRKALYFGSDELNTPARGDVADDLAKLVRAEALGRPLALYLTGSSCHGGLRPDSDIDLLLITVRSLQDAERRRLVGHLLQHSGRRATVRPGRAIELTSLVRDEVVPWRYPAVRDFLYGEWLRTDYESGRVPDPEPDPNLPVLITAAREHSQALFGPAPGRPHRSCPQQGPCPVHVRRIAGTDRRSPR